LRQGARLGLKGSRGENNTRQGCGSDGALLGPDGGLLTQLPDGNASHIGHRKAGQEGTFAGSHDRLTPNGDGLRRKTVVGGVIASDDAVAVDDEVKVPLAEKFDPLCPLNPDGNTSGEDRSWRRRSSESQHQLVSSGCCESSVEGRTKDGLESMNGDGRMNQGQGKSEEVDGLVNAGGNVERHAEYEV
jgi:hypothetical protein